MPDPHGNVQVEVEVTEGPECTSQNSSANGELLYNGLDFSYCQEMP